MSFTAIIPARKGSKGIPKKNIVELFGKPLIYWTIDKAIKSKCFDSIIVSTDCEEIAEISIKYGAKVPFLRPSFLATDKSSRNEVISFMFERIDNIDKLIYLQPTSPFRSIESIKRFILFTKEKPENPSFSISHITDNSSTLLIKKENYWNYVNNKFVINRQDNSEKIFKMDGSFFYINKNYWKHNKDNTSDYMRTKDTRFFINSFNSLLESIDIDNYNDLNFARSLKMNF